MYCIHDQGDKNWLLVDSCHSNDGWSVAYQKMAFFIVIAVKTSDFYLVLYVCRLGRTPWQIRTLASWRGHV
jgi:hypothetical protein